jgi:hypothetical protein
MRDLILLFVHVVTVLIRLVRPGGVRAVLAESVLLRHQLLMLNRSRHRGPNLRSSHRLITGLCAILVLPRRLVRSAIVVKPSSLLNFHRALVHRKYRLLFSAKRRTRPGPEGPSADLIRAVIEMKQRNPRWGCPRIAGQIALAFGIDINKDVVRRILAAHYQPPADHSGPSWLTFLGHAKDSLHSIDLFRCESVALRTYWVLVVMDQAHARRSLQQKFALRMKTRFHPFRDSAGCTIAMRCQRKLQGNSSEVKTLSHVTRQRRGSRFLRASVLGPQTSLRSQTEELPPSRKKSFSCRTKRFDDPQVHNLWWQAETADQIRVALVGA